MSRIRSVHPGLFTDEAFMAASMPARVLLIGLWTECDDNGIFEWKPLTLKARIMPADAVDIGTLLEELVALNFIRGFAQGDTTQNQNAHQYGAVRNFRRFQRPQKPRALHPLPDNEIKRFLGFKIGEYDTGTVKSPQMEDGRGRMEEEGGKVESHHHHPETRRSAPAREGRAAGAALDDGEAFDFPQEFAELWPLFPRKLDRGRALSAFTEARQRGVRLAVIRGGLERYRAACAGKASRHIARPENWLRNERWLDEADAEAVNGQDAAAYAYPAESPDHWRDRCALWFDRTKGGPVRSRWPDFWGPAPGEPRCRVPAEVLAEFGWKH